MSLQVKSPLNSLHSQNSSSRHSHSPPLCRATLSPLLHVSQSPNPSIKLMDSLSQDKMEALQAQPRRHDNTLALRQQQPNEDRFLLLTDELNSIGRPVSLLATSPCIMTHSRS